MFGLTISGVIVTVVLCFYFRNVVKTVANAAEDAVLSMTDAASEQVAGYAVQLTRDSIVESQEAITELMALDADSNVVRPSDYLRNRRQNRRTTRKAS